MDWNVKKVWQIAASSLVAFTAVVNADAPQQNSKALMVKNGEGPDMMITPNANPVIADGKHWFFTGEALFWNAREDGLEFLIEDEQYDTDNNVLQAAKMDRPNFKWDVGFRLGLGYSMEHDGWDIYGNWTWFETTASKEVSDCCNSNDELLPMFSDLPLLADAGNTGLTAGEADAHWKLRLNMVDVELGRAFMTSKWLALRPFVGLRAGWIKQSYDINYDDLAGVTTTGTYFDDLAISNIDMTNNFWGVGVRAGLNSRWGLGGGMSFYGNAALSILYGRFKVEQDESARATNSSPNVAIMDFEDDFRSSRAILDLALGLMWEHTTDDGYYHMAINAGWEHHDFFNQNQLWRVTRPSGLANNFAHERGDLTIQGWTVGLRFDF